MRPCVDLFWRQRRAVTNSSWVARPGRGIAWVLGATARGLGGGVAGRGGVVGQGRGKGLATLCHGRRPGFAEQVGAMQRAKWRKGRWVVVALVFLPTTGPRVTACRVTRYTVLTSIYTRVPCRLTDQLWRCRQPAASQELAVYAHRSDFAGDALGSVDASVSLSRLL
jgi:hypothetical protein